MLGIDVVGHEYSEVEHVREGQPSIWNGLAVGKGYCNLNPV